MLKSLTVNNYALIDELHIEWGPSLNIITGETGAGKSILLGALGLILGNRADGSALKNNTANCVIEGVFDLGRYSLQEFFEANDLEFDEQTTIRRVITPAGKSRAYINDLPVQLSLLKELSGRLIDIHSQHQSLLLGDEGFRTGIVDSVAANKDLGSAYRAAYRTYREAMQRLAKAKAEYESSLREEDYLRHQWEQIEALGLAPGQGEELEREQKELANAEAIVSALARAETLLEEEESGALAQLKSISDSLRKIADVYPSGTILAERIRSVILELRDISSEISSEAGRMEANPARLQFVEDRMNSIETLLRKHSLEDAEELILFGRSLNQRLAAIEGHEDALNELEREVRASEHEARERAAQLTLSREKAAEVLQGEVERILSQLGMPHSKFVCEITPVELSDQGADQIRFLFTANASVAAQPLEKIASGGEISRVMLALKSIVARSSQLPTIIFDEIDTGVSGKIADAMGVIIAELSHSMQVINITHLPQVASKGDTHLLVYKEESGEGVRTLIKKLSVDERIDEIAKMLSGNTVTAAALTQARELLGKN